MSVAAGMRRRRAGLGAGLGDAWGRIPSPVRRFAVPAAIVVALVYYPRIQDALSIAWLPTTDTAVKMAVFTIMALGLNMVVGYAGLLDLGYVAFYAAGAYVAGWFATQQFTGQSIVFGAVDVFPGAPGIHLSIWLLLIIAGLWTALLGILIGLPTLRLRGDYLAIVTLGFGEIIPQVVRNGDNFLGTGFNLTNGTFGLTPIDPMGFGGLSEYLPFLPRSYLGETNAQELYYWTGLFLVGITLFTSIRLRDSRLGRAWVAIREDEIAAAAMGVPLMRVKTLAYALGAFFGGVAGCFFAVYKSATFPDDFLLQISIFILCMVILGGMGNVWGVCVGACFLSYLNAQGLGSLGKEVNSVFNTSIDVPKYQFLIFGLIIVLTMLFRPQGLIPSSRRAAELEHGVSSEQLYDAKA
jgi:branched-chain amino acid transport system permease protein